MMLRSGQINDTPVYKILPFLLLPFAGQGQQRGPERIYGMVRINDSTFVDRLEISVTDWIEFMRDGNENERPDAAVLAQVPYGYLFSSPTSDRAKTIGTSGQFSGLKLALPADSMRTKDQRFRARLYTSYPIVGITYEQALAYCAWRTSRYGSYYAKTSMDSIHEVRIELPAPDEFDRLLTRTDSTNDKNCSLFNYRCSRCNSLDKALIGRHAFLHPGSGLVPADSYLPDANTLYQLHGNAAEMTKTRGTAKGGSFMEPAQQCARGWSQPYTKPEPWLGFRCIARIRAR